MLSSSAFPSNQSEPQGDGFVVSNRRFSSLHSVAESFQTQGFASLSKIRWRNVHTCELDDAYCSWGARCVHEYMVALVERQCQGRVREPFLLAQELWKLKWFFGSQDHGPMENILRRDGRPKVFGGRFGSRSILTLSSLDPDEKKVYTPFSLDVIADGTFVLTYCKREHKFLTLDAVAGFMVEQGYGEISGGWGDWNMDISPEERKEMDKNNSGMVDRGIAEQLVAKILRTAGFTNIDKGAIHQVLGSQTDVCYSQSANQITADVAEPLHGNLRDALGKLIQISPGDIDLRNEILSIFSDRLYATLEDRFEAFRRVMNFPFSIKTRAHEVGSTARKVDVGLADLDIILVLNDESGTGLRYSLSEKDKTVQEVRWHNGAAVEPKVVLAMASLFYDAIKFVVETRHEDLWFLHSIGFRGKSLGTFVTTEGFEYDIVPALRASDGGFLMINWKTGAHSQ